MIALASDHGAYALKEKIKTHLLEYGQLVSDFGSHSAESCDYADFAAPAAIAVAEGRCLHGIVLCTTGIGASIAANKIRGIRCALCTDPFMAEMTRRHNDANMLALGAGITGDLMSLRIVDIWLNTPFDGGRHQQRIDKITALERV